jgi:hypothetical protein
MKNIIHGYEPRPQDWRKKIAKNTAASIIAICTECRAGHPLQRPPHSETCHRGSHTLARTAQALTRGLVHQNDRYYDEPIRALEREDRGHSNRDAGGNSASQS